MKIEINNGTLDDIEFPNVLYKYRNWENEYHKRFITNREVYLASPKEFEDKIDCKIPIRYDLMTESEAESFYRRLIELAEQDLSRQQKRHKLRDILKRKDYLKEETNNQFLNMYFKELFDHLGILSLTAEPCLEAMWNKYADNNKGFCIGYNSRILFDSLGGGGKVQYFDEMPVLKPDPIMTLDERNWKQVYFKERKWEFEEEYRTQKFWNKSANKTERQISIPKEAFNCVIIGNKMEQKEITELIKAVENNIGKINIIEQENVC